MAAPNGPTVLGDAQGRLIRHAPYRFSHRNEIRAGPCQSGRLMRALGREGDGRQFHELGPPPHQLLVSIKPDKVGIPFTGQHGGVPTVTGVNAEAAVAAHKSPGRRNIVARIQPDPVAERGRCQSRPSVQQDGDPAILGRLTPQPDRLAPCPLVVAVQPDLQAGDWTRRQCRCQLRGPGADLGD